MREWGGGGSADWRAGGALAQFRLMSGQLEVHHSALCTAPVSPNLCCRGPYPQPGHSTREALTLRPILLWQLRSSRSNAKRYCYVYTVTPYSCLCQQQGYVCAKTREGWKREMTLRDRSEEKDGGRLQREKIDGTVSLSFCIAPSDPLPPTTSCSTSFFVVFYNSWCLVLRELLRVVTVLEVSSASSSSFNSRTSLKNLKMELKLNQEVSSCLSVPKCKRSMDTHTNIRMSKVHKIFTYCKAAGKESGR